MMRVKVFILEDETDAGLMCHAHIELPDGSAPTETLSTADPDDAVEWARQRTDWVLIQRFDGRIQWAGTSERPQDVHEDFTT